MRFLVFLVGAVTVALTSIARADAPSDDALALSKKLQAESGFVFTVPAAWKWDPKSDGELQVQSDDVFVAIASGDSVDPTFDHAISMMKRIGGADYKTNGDPKVVEQGGASAKLQMGTVPIKGKTYQFFVGVFNKGKKVLRFAALGADLKDSAEFKAIIDSIK